MASFVTLLLYYKVVFLNFCLEYKHNNGMTLSPDLELTLSQQVPLCIERACSMDVFVHIFD